MAIKINNQDLQARYINGDSIGKVMLNGWQIRPEAIPPVFDDYFWIETRFTPWSMRLTWWSGSPWWYAVSLETSYDKENWTDYTLGSSLTTNGKIYIRNKSETPTRFSIWHWDFFTLYLPSSWAYLWWDISTLICKYWTDTMSEYCFRGLFSKQKILSLPHFRATDLKTECFNSTFSGTWVILSDTEDATYKYPFRIPNTWTGTDNTGGSATASMFYSNGYIVSAPSVNTTYYSNVPVY